MKFIHYALSAVIALSAALTAQAEAPAGYYSTLQGKKDADLKKAVHTLVHNFTRVSSYSALPSYFQKTDVYPDSKRWWDMYSDIPLYAPSFNGLNREHSFPKSWWGGSQSVSAYVDLNHLYPSEMKANTAKSNYPLGTVDMNSAVKFNNGICKVGYPVNGQGGGASQVFEPDDEYKGDFARTYFYMATCYSDLTWKYTYMVSQNDYPTLNGWSVALLLEWHRKDPVSEKETLRNDAVFKIQNNRNPFIDLPELAEYIWGTKKGESFSPGSVIVTPVGDPELTAPVRDMELEFGQVAMGSSATTRVFVKAKNVVNAIDLSIWSGDATMFTLSSRQISASNACADDGYWLPVTYRPTAIGQHTTKLNFDYGMGSRPIILRGECLPVPTLTACTASAASDIESDRYTANWTYPDNEEIDYFIVTRTRYVGSQAYTEELPAEGPGLEITGFDESDSESYAVQSVRLGHRSPMSNVIFVEHSGVTGVETEQPLIIRSFGGFIRIICSAPQTSARIFDTAGRLIMEIDEIYQNFDIDLPRGVYFITTDQHPTPVAVAN